MERTRSVGTRMRPTVASLPSILTLRSNASRTRSSLLLATRSVKNCMAVVIRSGLDRLGLQHADEIEEETEDDIEREKQKRDQEHEDDDDFGRTDQLPAAGPVDLLHLAVGGDHEVRV